MIAPEERTSQALDTSDFSLFGLSDECSKLLLLPQLICLDAGVGLELDWRLMARHYSENARPGLRSSDPLGTETLAQLLLLLLLLSRADLNYENLASPSVICRPGALHGENCPGFSDNLPGSSCCLGPAAAWSLYPGQVSGGNCVVRINKYAK